MSYLNLLINNQKTYKSTLNETNNCILTMFFNNEYSMKKAEKLIKQQRERAKKRKESMDETMNSPSESETQSDHHGSVRGSLSGSMHSSVREGTVSYAEHKANKALNSIELTIASQEDREQDLETKIKDTVIEAKNKLAAGNKRAALRAMKKVKLEQAELQKVSSVIETLEAQKLHIESSINSINVLKVMQEGSETLQGLSGSTKISDIDNVIDKIRDTMEITAEINDILSTPVNNVLVDDDDLLRELEEMGDNGPIDLPVAPAGKLKIKANSDGMLLHES